MLIIQNGKIRPYIPKGIAAVSIILNETKITFNRKVQEIDLPGEDCYVAVEQLHKKRFCTMFDKITGMSLYKFSLAEQTLTFETVTSGTFFLLPEVEGHQMPYPVELMLHTVH